MTTSASILWTHFFFFAAAAADSASCTRVCVCVSVRTWTCLHPSLPSANRAARARTQRPKRKEGNGIHKSNAWAITMVHASACFGSVRFTSAAFSASASLSSSSLSHSPVNNSYSVVTATHSSAPSSPKHVFSDSSSPAHCATSIIRDAICLRMPKRLTIFWYFAAGTTPCCFSSCFFVATSWWEEGRGENGMRFARCTTPCTHVHNLHLLRFFFQTCSPRF